MTVITPKQIKEVEEKFLICLEEGVQVDSIVEHLYKKEKVGAFVLIQVLKKMLNLNSKDAANIIAKTSVKPTDPDL